MKEKRQPDGGGDSQMRIRPGFILGLLIVFVGIPFLLSLFLPRSGGPNSARRTMTQKAMIEMDRSLGTGLTPVREETTIQANASNTLSGGLSTHEPGAFLAGLVRTNLTGQVVDYWKTPYRIEVTVQTNYVIRSAGKNGKFGDKDDIVFDSLKKDFAKP